MGSPTSITLDRLCSRELFAAYPRVNNTTLQLIHFAVVISSGQFLFIKYVTKSVNISTVAFFIWM